MNATADSPRFRIPDLIGYVEALFVAPRRDAVRLPTDRALRLKRAALENGVGLFPGIMDELQRWGRRFGIRAPDPFGA